MKKFMLAAVIVVVSVVSSLVACTAAQSRLKPQPLSFGKADCANSDACMQGCMPIPDKGVYEQLIPSGYEKCTNGTLFDPCNRIQCIWKFFTTSDCSPGTGTEQNQEIPGSSCDALVPPPSN